MEETKLIADGYVWWLLIIQLAFLWLIWDRHPITVTLVAIWATYIWFFDPSYPHGMIQTWVSWVFGQCMLASTIVWWIFDATPKERAISASGSIVGFIVGNHTD